MYGNISFALLLTLLAGLSTMIGSALGIVFRSPGNRFMAAALGFAGGVMIFISFVELLARGFDTLGFGWGNVAFFAGMLAMWAVDGLVPHEYLAEHSGRSGDPKLLRTGLMAALGLGIHNFPEGMATLGAALEDARLGWVVAAAVAIHNIPEGLAVSAPIYAATGSRAKAFAWSAASGLAEPIGALMAALVLVPILTDLTLGVMLCGVAGLMVYVSLDELVPASREYGYEHTSIASAMTGMALMAASLWLMKNS